MNSQDEIQKMLNSGKENLSPTLQTDLLKKINGESFQKFLELFKIYLF